MPLIAKKTVVSVDLLCSKCRMKVMSLISKLEGITSIVLDPSKSTVTVIGEADPACIIKQVRKFSRTAQITSVGPPKEEKKDDKKDDKKDACPALPKTCQRCEVWYVVSDDYYGHCNIL
ncbi:heavy metal-associated isoprenylated plant protein 2-like [Coffea eugenioides]|uniref:heavy metal-associated isoprenylated plant protein 2-like n=1 Tax=Coffea eugenioides TaxID=49369 RepID=UPI000F61547A|nr:heavy metal-associated isoprenylated plant protein 2-like [Coffea eugenioides]